MDILITILIFGLMINAVMVVCVRNLVACVLIFMAQSLLMILLWILLQAPDLAITEAAVGAGVSSLLFFLALRRIRALNAEKSLMSKKKGGARHG